MCNEVASLFLQPLGYALLHRLRLKLSSSLADNNIRIGGSPWFLRINTSWAVGRFLYRCTCIAGSTTLSMWIVKIQYCIWCTTSNTKHFFTICMNTVLYCVVRYRYTGRTTVWKHLAITVVLWLTTSFLCVVKLADWPWTINAWYQIRIEELDSELLTWSWDRYNICDVPEIVFSRSICWGQREYS